MATSFPNAGPGIPPRGGVGLKAEHYQDVLEQQPDIGWFEVHAENYMGDGGPPHRALRRIRDLYPVSCHGVGLSIFVITLENVLPCHDSILLELILKEVLSNCLRFPCQLKICKIWLQPNISSSWLILMDDVLK